MELLKHPSFVSRCTFLPRFVKSKAAAIGPRCRLPGCVAQAETVKALKLNIAQAADDWLNVTPVKTEDEAKQLAAIQGTSKFGEESFPQPNRYLPPASRVNDDDD